MDKLKRLLYLADSQQAWKPKKLAVQPWETGLSPEFEIRSVIERTTAAILKSIYDNTNESR